MQRIKTAKVEMIVLNTLTFIVFNLTFWLCNLFPKHILEFESWHSILAILWNLIFHGAYFFFLIVCFTENKSLFSKKLLANPRSSFKDRFHIRRIFILFAIQLMIDLLSYGVSFFLNEYSALLWDTLTVAKWLVTYFILQKGQEKSIYKKRSLTAITLIFVFFITLFSVIWALKDIAYYHHLAEKYISTSSSLQQYAKNLVYISRFRNFLLDTAIGILLYIVHLISKNCKRKHIKEQSVNGFYSFLLLRAGVLCFASLIMYILKLVISPYNIIGTTTSSGSYHTYQPENFYVERQELNSIRKNGYRSNTYAYQATNYTVFYSKTKLAQFRLINPEKASDLIQIGNVIAIDNDYIEYQFDGQESIVYYNQVICYSDNGKPKAVIYPNIAAESENNILIKTCEKMISEGNMVLFEYSYKYLMKYDYDFIYPYISRYAEGDFYSDELTSLEESEYNKEYIIALCKSAVTRD